MANNRKYKTDPELLLAQGKAIVEAGEEARYLHKVEMVNLVLAGLTPSFLAKYCRDSKNAITGWVKAADECGFEALRDGKSTGRPPKLSAEQVAELDKLLGGRTFGVRLPRVGRAERVGFDQEALRHRLQREIVSRHVQEARLQPRETAAVSLERARGLRGPRGVYSKRDNILRLRVIRCFELELKST